MRIARRWGVLIGTLTAFNLIVACLVLVRAREFRRISDAVEIGILQSSADKRLNRFWPLDSHKEGESTVKEYMYPLLFADSDPHLTITVTNGTLIKVRRADYQKQARQLATFIVALTLIASGGCFVSMECAKRLNYRGGFLVFMFSVFCLILTGISIVNAANLIVYAKTW
jgi:hypothetical protein